MASGFKSLNRTTKARKTLSIANATTLTAKMELVFSDVKDPRVERTRVHLLTDILIIGILSVIAGGNGWEDMENYGPVQIRLAERIFRFILGYPQRRYV